MHRRRRHGDSSQDPPGFDPADQWPADSTACIDHCPGHSWCTCGRLAICTIDVQVGHEVADVLRLLAATCRGSSHGAARPAADACFSLEDANRRRRVMLQDPGLPIRAL